MEKTSVNINLSDLLNYYLNNKIIIISTALVSILIGFYYSEYIFRPSAKVTFINYKDSNLFNDEFNRLISFDDIQVTDETRFMISYAADDESDILVQFNQNFEQIITNQALNKDKSFSHDYKYQIIDNYKNIISFYTTNILESEKDFERKIELTEMSIVSKYKKQKISLIKDINHLIKINIEEKKKLLNKKSEELKNYLAYSNSQSSKNLDAIVKGDISSLQMKLQNLYQINEKHIEDFKNSLEKAVESQNDDTFLLKNTDDIIVEFALIQLYEGYKINPGIINVINGDVLKHELKLLKETNIIPMAREEIEETRREITEIILESYSRAKDQSELLKEDIKIFQTKLEKNQNLIESLKKKNDFLGIFKSESKNAILVEPISISKVFYIMFSFFLGFAAILSILFINYILRQTRRS